MLNLPACPSADSQHHEARPTPRPGCSEIGAPIVLYITRVFPTSRHIKVKLKSQGVWTYSQEAKVRSRSWSISRHSKARIITVPILNLNGQHTAVNSNFLFSLSSFSIFLGTGIKCLLSNNLLFFSLINVYLIPNSCSLLKISKANAVLKKYKSSTILG